MKNPKTPIILILLFIFHPLLGQVEGEKAFPQENGYKGIWFTLGQYSDYGDKYSGGLGTYTAKHIPLAVYSEEAQKTFFVYGGTTGEKDRYLLCMIGSYDHRTNKVSKPTVVHDKGGVDDPHDNPTLTIDDEGYIWVFVSGRGRTRMGFKYRSSNPYSIDSFEMVSEEEMTYPQPKFIPGKGFLNLFTKYTGLRELYFETSPDGKIWAEDKKLVSIKRNGDTRSGHYQISGQYGEKVVFFCNWHPDGNVDQRTNLYYLQTEDFGKTWTNADGEVMPIPLTGIKSNALVKEFFSKGNNVYLKDVNFDNAGNPVALYVQSLGHQPGPDNGPREWHVIHWNGSSWEDHKVTTSDHNYDTGSLWIDGPEWRVIAPTTNSPQPWGAGGEIDIWMSSDNGTTWSKEKEVTQNSERNHNYIRRVSQGKDPFLYFWADGNPDELSKSQIYFGDSKGRAWVLPYHMEKEMVKPKRLPSNFFMRLFSR